jgi:D-alanyl-lipoteichoic acid acyltransferase DltB (MBOAT superfamily)
MLFNSTEYLIFLPLVFVLYWFVFTGLRTQNFLLLVVSYVFYGWWDWRFLSLIAFSSVVDFLVAQGMGSTDDKGRKNLLLGVSLVVNLGMLGFFKYCNFFIDSFIDLFGLFGIGLEARSLGVILPVGISFYTFQTLSYTIDVYRGDLKPARDWVSFFAYVSFFPQLVAGPIERATQLLPQFYQKRTFDYRQSLDGLGQICWGLFKKVVIADNCAPLVNDIFDHYQSLPATTLMLGAVYFAFQIYGDFSGYSDIAIGTSKLFGFNLMTNFRYPYFSRDIAEFWRRWHISLSTWFRDYLYIPLGGSRGGLQMKLRNTLVIFVVSGFWHGANWTFVIWGFLNALYFLPLLLRQKNRVNTGTVAEGRMFPSRLELGQMITTFALTCVAWIFFRAESLEHALGYLRQMCVGGIAPMGDYPRYLPYIAALLVIEWVQRDKLHPLQLTEHAPVWRWAVMIPIIITIMVLGNTQGDMSFIYFQF